MKTLLVGYRAADLFEKGHRGAKRPSPLLEGDVTCHTLDIYHRHAIEKTHHVRTVCSPHLPKGPWDAIWFKTGPKRSSGELSLDLLQEISRLTGGDLKPPRFHLDFEGKERDRNSLLEKVAGDPGRVRDFSATWRASVPGSAPITLTSVPGCFCHRRPDDGGLALAEVAARELAAARDQGAAAGPLRLLDMGCGCGLVGFLVASAVKDVELVMVDSHSRAVEAANINAKNLGIPAEIILADSGTPARMDGTFDVFVGNPPYYSEYRIAEVFYETALRALRPGGTAYVVCKNAAGLEPVARNFFPSVETIRRRGCCVLKSVRPLSP